MNTNASIFTKTSYLIGEIIIYPHTNIPTDSTFNFIPCNGQEVSRVEYNDLYNVIGTRFGTASSSGNFIIPNLNNNSTSEFSLIKGDNNMYNINSINTTVNTISGGHNKIQSTIIHNHEITNPSSSNISFHSTNFELGVSINDTGTRANKTGGSTNADQGSGGGSNSTGINHTHNIIYNDGIHIAQDYATYSKQDTKNIGLGNLQNTSTQNTFIPSSIKINYMICYK